MKIRIENLANGGDGVGHLDDGRVVFIPRALPDDLVEIELVQAKKRWAKGRIVDVVERSPERTPAGCEHFEQCGGCSFQHLAYEAEFKHKSNAALEAFRRIARLEPPPGERIAASTPSGYRIRARLHARSDALGFHHRESHDVFQLRHCPILDPALDDAIAPLAAAVEGSRGEVLVETAGGGEIAVELRGNFDATHAERIQAIAAVRGVRFGGGVRGTPTIDPAEAFGPRFGSDVSLDIGRFRQSNGPMTPVLRDLVVRRVGHGSTLVELYAGSGSFTHHVAPSFDAVHAYERDEAAVALGNELSDDAGHEHVRFASADLDRSVPTIEEGATVLLDPPRTGANRPCEVIASAAAGRVVYVSCDIATLARDAKVLTESGLQLTSLDLVDMFPRTPHIEAVATWERDPRA